MKNIFIPITFILLLSCETNNEIPSVLEVDIIVEDTLKVRNEVIDSIDLLIESDYDMSGIDVKNVKEFKESLVKIEEKFGEQWDFCKCIVKGDSINKAFMNEILSDEEFDVLSNRFDMIDEKCKAFRVQNPNITPEQRLMHEKKVKSCLKEAGIK